MPVCKDRDYRAMQPFGVEKREKRLDTEYYFEGYATIFEKPYLLYDFGDGDKVYEKIDRHAFDGCDMSDVILQYDHEGKVLARISNQSLFLEINDTGLLVYGDLGGSAAAKALHEEIKAGLVTKMSFGFSVGEDSYDVDSKTRTILRIKKLYDVSAVSIPANDDTNIQARNFALGVKGNAGESRERLLELITFNLQK